MLVYFLFLLINHFLRLSDYFIKNYCVISKTNKTKMNQLIINKKLYFLHISQVFSLSKFLFIQIYIARKK